MLFTLLLEGVTSTFETCKVMEAAEVIWNNFPSSWFLYSFSEQVTGNYEAPSWSVFSV